MSQICELSPTSGIQSYAVLEISVIINDRERHAQRVIQPILAQTDKGRNAQVSRNLCLLSIGILEDVENRLQTFRLLKLNQMNHILHFSPLCRKCR